MYDMEKPTNNPRNAHPEIRPNNRFVVFRNPYCAPCAELKIFPGPGVKLTENMNHTIAMNVSVSTKWCFLYDVKVVILKMNFLASLFL